MLVAPSIKFAGNHLYTWVVRGTVRVKCLAHEHNAMSPARSRTRTSRSGVERTNHEATAPLTNNRGKMDIIGSSGHINWITLWRIIQVGISGCGRLVVGHFNGVAALTGFSFKKMYGRFVGTKKFGCNNKATILTAVSRGSTIRAN